MKKTLLGLAAVSALGLALMSANKAEAGEIGISIQLGVPVTVYTPPVVYVPAVTPRPRIVYAAPVYYRPVYYHPRYHAEAWHRDYRGPRDVVIVSPRVRR